MGSSEFPSLGESLDQCDIEWLTNAVIRFYSGWSLMPQAMGRRRFQAMTRQVSASLACMKLAEEPLQEGDERLCYLPRQRFELVGHHIGCAMDYVCCRQRELIGLIDEAAAVLEAASASSGLDEWGFGQRLVALGERHRTWLRREAWPIALAGRVIAADRLSPLEWHWFLAGIYWDLTARGFEGEPLGEPKPPPALDAMTTAAPLERKPQTSKSDGESVDSFDRAYDQTLETWVQRLNARSCQAVLPRLLDVGNGAEIFDP